MKKKMNKKELVAGPHHCHYFFNYRKKGGVILNPYVSLVKLLNKFLLEPLVYYFCQSIDRSKSMNLIDLLTHLRKCSEYITLRQEMFAV